MTIVSDRYPAPGPMALRCSEPGCRPERVPLPSPSAARTAAAGHLAAHGHRAGALRADAACGCGRVAESRVITHAEAGRVWRLAALCAPCIRATADARVLRPLNTRPLNSHPLDAGRLDAGPSAAGSNVRRGLP
ncbi:hypothetical protein [Streptomyces sp. UNOC14_S4]|uniref:hypothetical protein n=1 Tax=Streptomyces sp. UNOC14_S4 TaxID=2872340 RepID=UPI001E5FD59B|nr:hypothetical protein [Streptomyces sp. UNOC14_S4]MCC3768765.1 hypothetical protein [Streptomyces sp. UNOC14_S4]